MGDGNGFGAVQIDINQAIRRVSQQNADVLWTTIESSRQLCFGQSQLFPACNARVLAAEGDGKNHPVALSVFGCGLKWRLHRETSPDRSGSKCLLIRVCAERV